MRTSSIRGLLALESILCVEDPRAGEVREDGAVVAGAGGFEDAHDLEEVGVVHVAAFVWAARCLPPQVRQTSQSFALLALLGLGAAWEIFEFAADQGEWFVAQKGLHDTMTDLLCDAVGAAIGLFRLPSRAAIRTRPEPSLLELR